MRSNAPDEGGRAVREGVRSGLPRVPLVVPLASHKLEPNATDELPELIHRQLSPLAPAAGQASNSWNWTSFKIAGHAPTARRPGPLCATRFISPISERSSAKRNYSTLMTDITVVSLMKSRALHDGDSRASRTVPLALLDPAASNCPNAH